MKNLFKYILIGLIIITSCKKEEALNDGGNSNTFTPTVMTSVKGLVLDKNGDPISGVNVNIEGQLTSTSSKGLFSYNNINTSQNRAIINFEKTGYFKTSRAVEPQNDVANYIRIVMDEKQIESTFNASTGSNVTLNNGISLDLPTNAYSYSDGSIYSGDVNVSVNKISPGNSDFTMRIPGGDLRANDANGNDARLFSYGMLDVILTDNNGSEIITNDNTEIKFPIPTNMILDAPYQIPLWYYDNEDGIWKEEGIAIKNGLFYVGSVSHFSSWNFDIPGEWAGLEGRVLDCEGSPIANVLVIAGQQSTSTNSNGEFDMFITPNQNHTIQIITNYGDTTLKPISPVNTNTVYNAGDITICNPTITGKVIDCNGNPAQNILVYSSLPLSYAYSDINGEFSFFFPENVSTTIVAEGFFGTLSNPVSIPVLSANMTYNSGTIVLCEATGATTIAQAKQNISNAFASMENCIESLKDGFGAEALKNFLNLDEGEILSENWVDDMTDNIDGFLNLDAIDDNNQFDFNGNTGTYTWSQSTQEWSKSSTPSTKIIIEFPSSETTQNNDAIFTFHSYTDILLFYDGENISAPSSLNADLYIGGTRVFEINGNYTYDIGATVPFIPTNISTSLIFNPFTITITGTKNTSTEFEANLSIENNSGCLTSLHVDVKFTHDDFENIEDTDVIEVNTTMSHNDMEIEGYMNGDLIAIDDPSNHEINAMTDIDVKISGEKIAQLIVQRDSNDEDRAYIIYSDGSSEDAEVYYDPFATNVEQILFPFLGEW